MAIVQISRITHRQGRRENLPQLAGGELGWALDSRQLFIGNGTLEDGAPVIGNTEILTEFSNIFTSYQYQYSGFENVPVITSVSRELQGKLDDFVNIRDFGVQGKDDDVGDDTVGFQAAIDAAFNSSVPGRRALYIPAGTYYINKPLVIPSHAVIIGEGDTSTIIKYNNVATPHDSIFIIGLNQSNINITKIGFEGPTDYIVGSTTVPFAAIRTGERTGAGAYQASTNNNISITECSFNNIRYGVYVETNTLGVLIDNCQFNTVDQGVVAIPNVTSSATARAIKVSNNLFNTVWAEGVYFAANTTHSITSNNIFLDVGNNVGLTPVTSAIRFVSANNVSNSDMFTRSVADDLLVNRVTLGNNISIENGEKYKIGKYIREVGGTVNLAVASASANPDLLFTVSLDKTTAFVVNYSYTNGTTYRIGALTCVSVSGGTDVQWNDDYSTNDPIVGDNPLDLELSADQDASEVSIRFAGPTTGTINFSINYLG